MSEKYYEGKTAIVTGASSGIGRAVSLQLAENGAHVIAVARRANLLMELEEVSGQVSGTIHALVADISDPNSSRDIKEMALGTTGRIDMLINNAATGLSAPTADISTDKMEGIIKTNLLGTMRLSQEILKVMIEFRKGHLIFITSLAGKMGFPNLSAYSASKFGLEGFAQSVRQEVASQGIEVTVARPGVTDTQFFEIAGMTDFAETMRQRGKIHSPEAFAEFLLTNLPRNPTDFTFGRDKWFLKLLPLLPHQMRLKVLSLIS